MLGEIVGRPNMAAAYDRVVSNNGAAGVDKMCADGLLAHMQRNWEAIKQQILAGTYIPQAVRKVEIPKANGGKRMLGIPTVTDRMIQQAIAQKLTAIYDADFSGSSFGFRPKRSAHQAVRQSRGFLNEGYTSVVEMDMEKFFDKVNHDKLMTILSERITDKALLKLIRRYLASGILEGGLISVRSEGTPQGSPLSPILSNILLDKLDKELEGRGHRFVRYADDVSIYVKSKRAAERTLQSVTSYLEDVLLTAQGKQGEKQSEPSDGEQPIGIYLRKGLRILGTIVVAQDQRSHKGENQNDNIPKSKHPFRRPPAETRPNQHWLVQLLCNQQRQNIHGPIG